MAAKAAAERKLLAQLDMFEDFDAWAWAEIASHLQSGTVAGSLELLAALRNTSIDSTAAQQKFKAELDAYRQKIKSGKFDPIALSEELLEDYGKAMQAARDKGNSIHLAVSHMQQLYGDTTEDMLDNLAKELFPKFKRDGKPLTYAQHPKEAQTYIQRQLLEKAQKNIGNLNLAATLGGFAEGGFVMLNIFIAVHDAKQADNFTAELSLQLTKIGAGEVLLLVARRGLILILDRIGFQLATKPVPLSILLGVGLIIVSFFLDKGLDAVARKSGAFDKIPDILGNNEKD